MKNSTLSIILALAVTACHSMPAAVKSGDAIEKSPSEKTTGEQSLFVPESAAENAQTGVTGTYYYKSGGRLNIIEVQETGKGNLRAAFGGIYEYKSDGEWMSNAGGTGVVTAQLNGEASELRLEDYPDCRISLKFKKGKLIVRQEESCGFGGNVVADGVYNKVKNAVPNFGREFNQEEYEKLPDTTFNAGQIRFPKGASETTVSGEITETQKEISYIINARKGQTLDIAILVGGANVDLGAYIIAPDGLNIMGEQILGLGWRGKLPVSGNYKIVVYANETEFFKYKMRVSIK